MQIDVSPVDRCSRRVAPPPYAPQFKLFIFGHNDAT